jgi:hypothetical protein
MLSELRYMKTQPTHAMLVFAVANAFVHSECILVDLVPKLAWQALKVRRHSVVGRRPGEAVLRIVDSFENQELEIGCTKPRRTST